MSHNHADEAEHVTDDEEGDDLDEEMEEDPHIEAIDGSDSEEDENDYSVRYRNMFWSSIFLCRLIFFIGLNYLVSEQQIERYYSSSS